MSGMITIAGVSLTHPGAARPAVDDVSLVVAEGELLALLGPSGAGKTTLLRMIAGFDTPSAGAITVGGTLVSGPGIKVPPERRGLGFVFQHGALFPHLTVRQNIAFGLRHLAPGERARRIEEVARLAALEGLLDRHEHQLSGGERQRAALARALARGCAAVLLDEPLSSVDRPLRMGIGAELRAILRSVGATAILVTHDQEEALGLADRVALLDRGRLVQVGTPEELLRAPASPVVTEFLSRRAFPDRSSPTLTDLAPPG